MIFNKQDTLKLEILLNPDVEEAINTLLDIALTQENDVLTDLNASEAQLRAYQGKCILIEQLKGYRQRLLDAIRG